MIEQAQEDALKNYREILPPNVSPGEATEPYKGLNEVAYSISRLPLGTARALKVICVGAGFSGLAFAREVELGNLPNVSLTVYEKNASVGGTWYENRYPGCVTFTENDCTDGPNMLTIHRCAYVTLLYYGYHYILTIPEAATFLCITTKYGIQILILWFTYANVSLVLLGAMSLLQKLLRYWQRHPHLHRSRRRSTQSQKICQSLS